jgi:hypothetical protein
MRNSWLALAASLFLGRYAQAGEIVSVSCQIPRPLTIELAGQDDLDLFWRTAVTAPEQKAPEIDFSKGAVRVAISEGLCTLTQQPPIEEAASDKKSNAPENDPAAQAQARVDKALTRLKKWGLVSEALVDGVHGLTAQPSLVLPSAAPSPPPVVPAPGKKRRFKMGPKTKAFFKEYGVPAACVFGAGFLDGLVEAISFHYANGFKKAFPKANDQFWNPAVSWKNKYKNGDPLLGPKFIGSTGIFSATTDAYHMFRTLSRALNTGALIYALNDARTNALPMKKKIRRMIIEFLALTAIRNLGFFLSYGLLCAVV